MFGWSLVLCPEQRCPEPPSPGELVSRTLMLELESLLKHSERQQQERAATLRRQGSSSGSSPSVDYSWLANPQRISYHLPPQDYLELRELCGRVPPAQCGPLIHRVRRLVTEFEPDMAEVTRLFRSVLQACLDEAELEAEEGGDRRRGGGGGTTREGGGTLRERAQRWSQEWEMQRRQRQLRIRSLSLVNLHGLRIHPVQDPAPRLLLPSHQTPQFLTVDHGGGGAGGAGGAGRTLRASSMPQINVIECSAGN